MPCSTSTHRPKSRLCILARTIGILLASSSLRHKPTRNDRLVQMVTVPIRFYQHPKSIVCQFFDGIWHQLDFVCLVKALLHLVEQQTYHSLKSQVYQLDFNCGVYLDRIDLPVFHVFPNRLVHVRSSHYLCNRQIVDHLLDSLDVVAWCGC